MQKLAKNNLAMGMVKLHNLCCFSYIVELFANEQSFRAIINQGGHAIQPASSKKEKHRLSSIIDDLEGFVEVRTLSAQAIELKTRLNAQIARLLRKDELKWYQQTKVQFITEADSNTRYTPTMWPTADIGRN
jgi:hypothetical protein